MCVSPRHRSRWVKEQARDASGRVVGGAARGMHGTCGQLSSRLTLESPSYATKTTVKVAETVLHLFESGHPFVVDDRRLIDTAPRLDPVFGPTKAQRGAECGNIAQ